MAKARRTRTLRSRKSRNRRGGLFGISDVEKFKEKLERVASIKQILDECREQKNCKIDPDNLNPTQKLNLKTNIVKILDNNADPSVSDLKNYIKGLSEDDYNNLKDKLYQAEKSFVYTNVAIMCRNDKILQQAKDANTMADILAQGGGKSRRRHRRGRTLHKRRKSRKVRKTRCRRK